MSAPAGVYVWESRDGAILEIEVDSSGDLRIECPCGDLIVLEGRDMTIDSMGRPTISGVVACEYDECGWRGWIRNGVECGSADEEAS